MNCQFTRKLRTITIPWLLSFQFKCLGLAFLKHLCIDLVLWNLFELCFEVTDGLFVNFWWSKFGFFSSQKFACWDYSLCIDFFFFFLQDFIRRCLTYNQADRPDVLTIAQDPYLTYTKKWQEYLVPNDVSR